MFFVCALFLFLFLCNISSLFAVYVLRVCVFFGFRLVEWNALIANNLAALRCKWIVRSRHPMNSIVPILPQLPVTWSSISIDLLHLLSIQLPKMQQIIDSQCLYYTHLTCSLPWIFMRREITTRSRTKNKKKTETTQTCALLFGCSDLFFPSRWCGCCCWF